MRPINAELDRVVEEVNQTLGVGVSFDVLYRPIDFSGMRLAVYGLNGFFQSLFVFDIVKAVERVAQRMAENKVHGTKALGEAIYAELPFVQVDRTKDLEKALINIMSGPIAIFVDGQSEAILVDTRLYPARNPDDPAVERVVRGPRDGYTETLVTNVALTRRRLRDPGLRFELHQVGQRSKTDVCLVYINDIVNPDLLAAVRKKIQGIRVDGIPMAEQSIEEFLIDNKWNPYPMARYTERPDVVATHLLQGYMAIFVDTSPEVIILPTTFVDHVQHPEDYHQTPLSGTYMRWILLLSVILSVLLPPVWLALIQLASSMPALHWVVPHKESFIPIWMQMVFAEMGMDILRRAVINTPMPLGNALGIVAGVIFGQTAVTVGLYSAEVMVFMAVTFVASFATSSPELAAANRLVRMMLLILTTLIGPWGCVVGILGWFALLGRSRSFGVPYFWPILPFHFYGFKQMLVREPLPDIKTRISALHPVDPDKRTG
ncbi:spore germination protein [Kyrpidia spormannii]|uniref:Spore germination protein n=1 Tax=Kyrpidia spormannii TaxID=2055160 RepID=A0A6F9E7M3_9BACL|nr:spore germination protein [Kyrpidia spormannii]CAB3392501.1 Spore germination protein [Kyrpidia spormannii]